MIHLLGDGVLADAIRMNVDLGHGPNLTWIAHDEGPIIWTQWSDTVIISTPCPIGTCADLEHRYPHTRFAVVPENLRTKTAERDFRKQDRIVIGTRHPDLIPILTDLFHPYTNRIICMSPESAEMTKHALNGFLAMSIQYANRINDLCHIHGADYTDVLPALLADRRIGSYAYLTPGEIGAHLQREVNNLDQL